VPNALRWANRIVREGDVADPSDPPPGCPFHPRCRYAVERCRQEAPELEESTGGSFARCHRKNGLALSGATR
jgi:peptide/nickel transport system ATP-binding protein